MRSKYGYQLVLLCFLLYFFFLFPAAVYAYDANAVAKEVMALNKVKFIDRSGKVVIPPRRAMAFSGFHEGLCHIYAFDDEFGRKDLQEGYIDKKNNWVIKPRIWQGAPGFVETAICGAANFSMGRAPKHYFLPASESAAGVVRFGYIDRSGKFVISPSAEWESDDEFGIIGAAFDFSEELALIRLDKYIRKGQTPFIRYPELSQYVFLDGTGKRLFHLSKGMKAIEPRFLSDRDWILLPELPGPELEEYERKIKGSSFSNGLALIDYEGKYGFIKKDGTWLGSTYDNAVPFSEGLAFVQRDGKTGFINTDGKMLITFPKESEPYAASFHEGLCRLRPKWRDAGSPCALPVSFIDKTGKIVFTLDSGKEKQANLYTGDFSSGLALVKWGEKGFGYIDRLGKWRIPPQFYKAEPFCEGIARVMFDELHCSYIDTNGKVIWDCGVMHGTRCSEGLIGVWSK